MYNINKLDNFYDDSNQAKTGMRAWFCKPQVLPAASLICPWSPHVAPQEFRTSQTPSVSYPTSVTAWLRFVVPQFLKTPDLYGDQFEASTQIDTGPVDANDYLIASPVNMTHGLAEFKNFFAVAVDPQDPWRAVYGYSVPNVIPALLI